MTLGFSLHWYKGFYLETALFWKSAVCGFVTLSACKGSLLDRLFAIMEKLPAEKVRGE